MRRAGSKVPKFNCSMVQLFKSSKVQWFKSSMVQRFNGSKVQWLTHSRLVFLRVFVPSWRNIRFNPSWRKKSTTQHGKQIFPIPTAGIVLLPLPKLLFPEISSFASNANRIASFASGLIFNASVVLT